MTFNYNTKSVQVSPNHEVSIYSMEDIDAKHIVRNTQDSISDVYNKQGTSSKVRTQLNNLFI